ncbi:MAG TPA: alpha/beta hydrolase, partial [Mangrovimonas sp.]|nr:alpha/beta hydrolase [Mangrovimonas sp.]
TLFLRGDRSEYISIQDESIIKNHFPKAEVVTITNAGHWLHAENPTDFFNEVMQFLNK